MRSGPSSRLLRRRRFDVADLGRMTKAGVLQADERLELIEGELVEMGVPGPRHSGRVDRLARLLFERCGERSIVRVQNPLLLDAPNLYLPDLALLRPTVACASPNCSPDRARRVAFHRRRSMLPR